MAASARGGIWPESYRPAYSGAMPVPTVSHAVARAEARSLIPTRPMLDRVEENRVDYHSCQAYDNSGK